MERITKILKAVITLMKIIYLVNIQNLYNNFIFPSDTCRYTEEKRNSFEKQWTEPYGSSFYKLAAIRTNIRTCYNDVNYLNPIFYRVLLPQALSVLIVQGKKF